MKYILLIASMFCYMTVTAQTPSKETGDNFNKLNWLIGTWTRTNAKQGRSAHERWEKATEKEMKGWGVNLKGQDTAFVEKLKIVIKDANIYYVADVPENKEPVYFKLTQISANGFTCENPEHDFPKKITYQVEGNKLKATISGNGKAIDYFFEKKQ